MSSITVQSQTASFVPLELRTAYGPVYRQVSTAPPRDARADEIPVIDIGNIHDSPEARKGLAKVIKQAAEGVGFFYIKNHGIDDAIIGSAQRAALAFFKQPADQKQNVSISRSKYYNGYTIRGTAQISPSESVDNKEGFMWRYDPKYDPEKKSLSDIPEEVRQWLRGEDFLWEGTSHLPSFQKDTLKYWTACLTLARALAKVFAICQDLPENYFDELTTYPGADGVYNFYPALSAEELAEAGPNDVGIGSHTDLQCFTLLWQDQIGGLQVLNQEGQWIKAHPISGTFVVNIGDFLMRMTNDRFKSTVHRVYNRSTSDRLSMPFFFGFNFNEKCSVLPTCTDEMNPPKYDPISCGEWCELRFKQNRNGTSESSKELQAVSITVKA